METVIEQSRGDPSVGAAKSPSKVTFSDDELEEEEMEVGLLGQKSGLSLVSPLLVGCVLEIDSPAQFIPNLVLAENI